MSTPPASERRVRLSRKARLRRDALSGQTLLLYPERGLLLNQSAGDVLALCTGEHTLNAIVARLAKRRPAQQAVIERDVRALLHALEQRGLVEWST
jgi:pyrroloquinoline quinone biosynthesis protein D